MKITYKKSKGFTLVEILVVIAIIAALATVATPALLRAVTTAKITKSAGVCTALESAINNFEAEYNYLPFGGGTAPTEDELVRTDDELIAVLTGKEDDLNFKKVRYFETGEAKGRKDGLDSDTDTLYDPWGETYYVIIDYDLDGEIDFDGAGDRPIGTDDIVTKKAAIYSLGPDMKGGSVSDNRDNASNFE